MPPPWKPPWPPPWPPPRKAASAEVMRPETARPTASDAAATVFVIEVDIFLSWVTSIIIRRALRFRIRVPKTLKFNLYLVDVK
jgi:hypothetical protein